VVARGRLRAEVGTDFSINRDAAVGNQFVTFSARTDPGGGEEAIQTHGSGKSEK
jgi:hypothetical protein